MLKNIFLIIKKFTLLILLFIAVSVLGEDEAEDIDIEELVRVIIQSSPEEVVSGSEWTLTLLIAHDNPNRVAVVAPPFPGAAFLDKVLKGPRIINPANGQTISPLQMKAMLEENEDNEEENEFKSVFEHWTFIEYYFILTGEEIMEFESFRIITPHWQEETEPFEIEIQPPKNIFEIRRIRLVWENLPSSLETGQRAMFSLRFSNSSHANEFSNINFLRPSVPQGHILETIIPGAEDKSNGIALQFHLIPLDAKPFVMERRQITNNNIIFEIPAVNIRVNPKSSEQENNNTDAENRDNTENNVLLKFPAISIAVGNNTIIYNIFKKECDEIYNNAKKLWEGGKRAEALAYLRQNERDHVTRNILSFIRREAERVLGINNTNNEIINNTFLPAREVMARAVLKETAFRRIPDIQGEVIDNFKEGMPVLVYPIKITNKNVWRRIVTNDNMKISGWIPQEKIIFY